MNAGNRHQWRDSQTIAVSDVEVVVAEVQKSFEAAEYEQLQEFLRIKRDEVNKDFRSSDAAQNRPFYNAPKYLQPQASNPLDAFDSQEAKKPRKGHPGSRFSVFINKTTRPSVTKIPIAAADKRLPSHTMCVPIRNLCAAEDAADLLFVPPLDNSGGDMGDVLSEYSTTQREQLIEFGAECEQQKAHAKIDEVLLRIFDTTPFTETLSASDLHNIATALNEKVERVQSRFEMLVASLRQEPDSDIEEQPSANMTEFDETLSSCRDMWCRLCYRYDCSIHGQRDKPSVETQLELALLKEANGFWKGRRHTSTPQYSSSDDSFGHISSLSESQKSMCFMLYSVFDGDAEQMSTVIRAPTAAIQEYLDTYDVAGIEPTSFVQKAKEKKTKEKKTKPPYYSVRNYNQPWYVNYRDAPIFPRFFPCNHDEQCSDDNCTCVQNNFVCTLACGWARESRNFFRGCECKASCRTTSCTCVALKRECDPDLCKCSGCSESGGFPTLTPECHNSNILMERSPILLIAKSGISGWGLFTKYALQKGGYVGEYVGEAISQGEADRRGKLADARNCSYIFMVASDKNIDSSRKGNNTRLINHSSTPNVAPKILFVKGQQRIGFYALQDIEAQTELFFDYRYKTEMDNDLVEYKTPSAGVGWMEGSSKKKGRR